MTDPLPARIRARRRPLRVPANALSAPLPVERVTPGPDALRAAYNAHTATTDAPQPHYACATCRRYMFAIIEARAAAALTSPTHEPPPPTPT